MAGLSFDLATFLTATYSAVLGASLGATVTLWVAWKGTKKHRDALRQIAQFLDDSTPGRGFTYDEDGWPTGRSMGPGA